MKRLFQVYKKVDEMTLVLLTISVLMVAGLTQAAAVNAAGVCHEVLHAEPFVNLKSWQSFRLPGVDTNSDFEIVDELSGQLRVRSEAGGSGILWKNLLDMDSVRAICWRAKVVHPLQGADLSERSGDDSPLRLTLLYSEDRRELEDLLSSDESGMSIGEFLKGSKGPSMLIYSAIMSDFEGGADDNIVQQSPYSERIQVITWVADESGQWQEKTATPRQDYFRAFGATPPRWAMLALISDTDNTDGKAVVDMEALKICR